MKTTWAFREVETELLLLAWVSISWGLDFIVSGLRPNYNKLFVVSPKCPDQLWGPYMYIYIYIERVCIYIYIYIYIYICTYIKTHNLATV